MDAEPTPTEQTMTAEQLAEAREYGRLGLVTSLADRALDIAVYVVMAFFFAKPLDAWLATWAWLDEIVTLRLAVFILMTFFFHVVVSLGLSFYTGYIVERRFGMSNQNASQWLAGYLQRNLIAAVVALAMFTALYWSIWLTGSYWWLVAAAAFFLFTILGGQLGPVLLLPLFYRLEKLDEPALNDRLRSLAEPAGLSIEGIYQLDMSEETNEANAALAGLGRTRRVLLGTKILEEFTAPEILVVFAHEIGHHVYHHIHKKIILGGLYGLAGLWACDRVMLQVAQAQNEQVAYADFPVWMLPLVMLLITLFSQVLEPLWNAISRRFERQCDRYALQVTADPQSFRSAFWKLARLNKDDPNPHRLEVFLFHSHPSTAERLAIADEAR